MNIKQKPTMASNGGRAAKRARDHRRVAHFDYVPQAVIAGFPTVQVVRDREGARIAPVTLRRVDLTGARA